MDQITQSLKIPPIPAEKPKLNLVPPPPQKIMNKITYSYEKKAGDGSDDPANTLQLAIGIIRYNIKKIKNTIKRGWILYAVMAVVWLIFMTLKTYTLPAPLKAISFVFIFLSSAYNNFVAKILYLKVFSKDIIPLFKAIKNKKTSKYFEGFKLVPGKIGMAWKEKKRTGTAAFLSFLGISIAIGNFLMRNNRIDKYFICLMLAYSMYRGISQGNRAIQYITGRVVSKDIFGGIKKNNPFDESLITLSLSGIMCGFGVGSFLMSQMWRRLPYIVADYTGYIVGGFVLFAGIIVAVVAAVKSRGKNAQNI